MKNKSLGNMHCPIARSLDHVGEWWNILILREAMLGATKFDEFQKNLSIATSTLTKRLTQLADSGLLEKQQYCEKPPRYEYVITRKGLDFRSVLITILQWGNKYYSDGDPSILLIDKETGIPAEVMLVDKNTNREITSLTHQTIPGPAASQEIIERYQRRNEG